MSAQPERFDRDVTIEELLRAVPRAKLERVLTRSLGPAWRIVDPGGRAVWESGHPGAGGIAFSLRVDIEVIARLEASEARREQAEAAAQWLEMVLLSAHRYRMAADLHFETVTADFEALQRQHAALQESEQRYRDLAGQLEQRVKAQVEVIERTQRQLYQNEKLASIGSLAAGMAHEINNPIGFIRSNLGTASNYVKQVREVLHALRGGEAAAGEALWKKFDIDFVLEDFLGLLAESASGAERVSRIVANLKAYSNIDCSAAVQTDLNDAARSAAAVIGDQLPENIRIELALQPLPQIRCDLSRMNQVLFALLQNAVQSLGTRGGTVRIASAPGSTEVRIVVTDTGSGIDAAILNRIFDPFFTTREVGKGMGLGLTVSRDIVIAHGGRIEVDSSPGVGSSFSIFLPTAGAGALPASHTAERLG